MLPKYSKHGREASNKDNSPLLPADTKHRKEWIAAANSSECAQNIEKVLKDLGRTDSVIAKFKSETFDKVYDALAAEVDGEDLVRALVVRNEKFGTKMSIFLTIITLGLFCCFRPRDDDTVLVLTKQGRLVQLKVERPSCCPASSGAKFFVFAKYVAILFSIFVLPVLVSCAITGRSVEEQLHAFHLDWEGIQGFPAYANEHRVPVALTVAVALFWIGTLLPHDFRDRYRRRHMVREVAAGQYHLRGWSCFRQCSIRLFFGTYPHQNVLDLAGTLGNASCCGPIPPRDLVLSGRPSASGIIIGLTIFLSALNAIDTAITWGERSMALEHAAEMQLFCRETSVLSEGKCTKRHCKHWVSEAHPSLRSTFCKKVHWEPTDNVECRLKFARDAPCCTGCQAGAYEDATDEGTLATIKSLLSLFADVGTLLFTFTAAKFALSMSVTSDHIDVLIKRRSSNALQMEIAKFDNTHPVGMDFMEYVFGTARNSLVENKAQASGLGHSKTVPLDSDDGSKWCGVNNYEIDDTTKHWEDYFEQEMLLAPDCRWTSRLTVPSRCLGLARDERVLAAWVETPLYPFQMSASDLLFGGLIYQLLPFGKTRHAIIVTNRRLFYVRYRRPSIPLKFIGVAIRIDCFRHDHDVFYGNMHRTKVNFVHKLVHQTFLREQFLPGTVALQSKFGALQIYRAHGDVLDVYDFICQLSRNNSQFVNRQMLEENGVRWDRCQENLESSLSKTSETRWAINPQSDDVVLPQPDIQLSSSNEQLVFHMSFKDIGPLLSKCYTNTDVVMTTGRLFFWHRSVYKKFDCQASLYWCCFWRAFVNPIFSGKNLPNSCSFFTLPSILSFSTDLSIDPASWLVPHHQPLKCPCWETLTGGRVTAQGMWRYSCCPKRTGPSAKARLMWRLKQSAHADEEFIIEHHLKPYIVEEAPESDADDIMAGLGFTSADLEERRERGSDHEEQVEAFRRIMCVVQDQCNRVKDEIETIS
mmetsp:Transcript_36288/g.91399  ORF Transcript_36288/g.91399 Transcript_36288/m.91399 type:complete len:982 (-) Transcript_36288:175-3120(-)